MINYEHYGGQRMRERLRGRFQMIFENLASNAFRMTFCGSRVAIRENAV
jgi:hypothetical protein